MYRRLYLLLFNRVTDAIEKLRERRPEGALHILMTAQQDCEEIYISTPGDECLKPAKTADTMSKYIV